MYYRIEIFVSFEESLSPDYHSKEEEKINVREAVLNLGNKSIFNT